MIWYPSSEFLSSPLLKIPLVLSCTAITTLAQSPPNPPAAKKELDQYEGKREALSTPLGVRMAAFMYKATYWASALGETSIILAEHYPCTPLSDAAFAVFAPRAAFWRSPGGVRITGAWLAGCALMCGGAALRLWCYRTLGRFFTWELSVKEDHRLVTRGPYAVVRHPSYVGSAMIGIGVVLCYCSPGGWYRECVGWDTLLGKVFTAAWATWTLSIPAMLFMRVDKEDAVMRREFGAEWEAYAKRTPYRLIPFVY
ncbi:isoprenylcysteine carboxylmethyltransferase family protein [Phanerochaete sordida]|uniref:Protein-S-isoprenylcysteine O-methyltransferase n=1 Tax=Phanerochaete sordida TaxID=48140 RepID=A0A9P3GF88_9APHY|nr:isoprenylcysteine carboxylmethyltransferase family protein [Phanerochaete sordida]